jgi:ribosome biogenesis GTPase
MDVLLIVASVRSPALKIGVIDRFLIVAQRGELTPLIVINKTDLAQAPHDAIADLRARGLNVLTCSAVSNEGLDAVLAALAGKQSVLAGASGVGKSTLINALVPGAGAATNEVRQRDQRGRHTTSSAAVYDLPGGGIVVDTPGVRELGVGLTAAELPWYFPEFETHAPRCRFNDCTHTHEPGCAVVAAASECVIPPARYAAYLRLLETLDE